MGLRERADGDDRAAEVANSIESSVVTGLVVQARSATVENTHHHYSRPRWAVFAAVAVVLVAAGVWFAVEVDSGPEERGDPISLVGAAAVVGDREYARPDRLGTGPEYESLLDTTADAYRPPSDSGFVPVGTTTVSFLLRGNRSTPVQVTDVRPEISERRPPLTGTLLVYPPPSSEKPAIELSANLDDPRLIVRNPLKPDTAWFTDHHVELAKDETQQFSVTFFGRLASYSFRIAVDYVDGDGNPGRLTVSAAAGSPFQVTGKPADGRYGIVFLPNFPASYGWYVCGTRPEDRCLR
ncbi:hypothetical protein V5P93_004726 [Actinokineospora auranticolor]|uniref:Uncharacterized protein n=1 Tax=Actinokineospora auranticolor TaxID=155976 RepID=A0A2S6GN75_9PSEU|nr:hypothetical protein [Actinokineospora auranticolor]PPK66689.1 hypothetical protein CLV40_10974 [Actinokineospora auranticolor]